MPSSNYARRWAHDGSMTLHRLECLTAMKEMPENSVDSIVTDPPYELGFMGKSWDNSGIAYSVEMWSEALRVLKPGGHLLAFSGSRTYHRMVVAIEDSGFEIRDQIMWVYGSGFPKSLDVSKAIDKGTGENLNRQLRFTEWMRSTGITAKQINEATKTNMGGHYLTEKSQPAIPIANLFDKLRYLLPEVPEEIERLVAERTGIEWTAYKNREVIGETKKGAQTESTGRYGAWGEGITPTAPSTDAAKQWEGWGTALKPAHEPIVVARKPLIGTVAANVLEYGTGALNIDASRITIAKGDEPSAGHRTATFGTQKTVSGGDGSGGWQAALGRFPANFIHDGSDEVVALFPQTKGAVGKTQYGSGTNTIYGKLSTDGNPTGSNGTPDSGSAARFFYCAKASKSERNAGLEGLEKKEIGAKGNGLARTCGTCGSSVLDGCDCPDRTFNNPTRQNFHPTVKPLALMRYLVRLVTPPGGVVFDPFLGSGTTAVAAILEGFKWAGCEMTEDYWPIIEARVEWAKEQPPEIKEPTLF